MRRARWNWHVRAVETLLFVVVFSAATVTGSPRDRDGRRGLRERSGYSRTLLIPGRRVVPGNEDYASTVDDDVAKEQEEELDGADVEEKPREFVPEPLEIEYEVLARRENDSALCAVMLLKRHPEICDVVDEMSELRTLLPRVRSLVTRRMGGRRFNFVYLVMRGKTAMEQLHEAVRCMSVCIKKFAEFLGSVEEVIGPVTPTPSVLTPLVESYRGLRMNRPYPRWSEKQPKNRVDPSLSVAYFDPTTEDEENDLRVEAMDNGRRGPPGSCAASIVTVDPDVCGTLAKMELLDNILENSGEPIAEEEDSPEGSRLPMELDSDVLALGKFLEALRESLLDAESRGLDVEAMGKARGGSDTGGTSTRRGRRRLVNAKDEEVAEIFQTPDFEIEFLPRNGHRRIGYTRGPWSNVMVDGNRKSEGRRICTAEDGSLGFDAENAKRRAQGPTQRCPSATVRRAREVLPKKNRPGDGSTSWYGQSSRSLGKKLSSRDRDGEEQREPGEIRKRSENRAGGWRGPRYAADRITAIGKYPHYRVGDPDAEESSEPEKEGEERCVTDPDVEGKNDGWREWLFSKIKHFSTKVFGT